MGCPVRGCLRFCSDQSSVLQVKLVLVDLEYPCVLPANNWEKRGVHRFQLQGVPVELGHLEEIVVFYAFPAADSQPPSRLCPQQAVYEVFQFITDCGVVPVPMPFRLLCNFNKPFSIINELSVKRELEAGELIGKDA